MGPKLPNYWHSGGGLDYSVIIPLPLGYPGLPSNTFEQVTNIVRMDEIGYVRIRGLEMLVFSENFAYVLNGWSLTSNLCYFIIKISIHYHLKQI